MLLMLRRLMATLALLWLASSLLQAQGLQIMAANPGAIVGEPFVLPLHVNGGTQPFTWQVTSGNLPPGCKLHQRASNISGIPTEPGDYQFTISVGDSNIPQQQATRDFTVHVIAGLTIDWKEAPAVHGTAITGSLVVSNQTPRNFDLTVVVVAVNSIERATTLGYQHINIAAQGTQVIPFGASPGPETYYVRADAAAHHPGRDRVYRASKQTPASITVSQF